MEIGGFVPNFKNYKDIPPIKDPVIFTSVSSFFNNLFLSPFSETKHNEHRYISCNEQATEFLLGEGKTFPENPGPPKEKCLEYEFCMFVPNYSGG